MGNSWRACVPVHAPAGAGKNAKPHGLFACGSQVGIELYHMYICIILNQAFPGFVHIFYWAWNA